jgi:hypothetical protein
MDKGCKYRIQAERNSTVIVFERAKTFQVRSLCSAGTLAWKHNFLTRKLVSVDFFRHK